MNYIGFVLTGLTATALGFGLGWAMTQWERTQQGDETDGSHLLNLLFVVGFGLALLSGAAFLISEVWLVWLIVGVILAILGFHHGHPDAVRRLRQLVTATQDIGSSLSEIGRDQVDNVKLAVRNKESNAVNARLEADESTPIVRTDLPTHDRANEE